MSWFEKYVGREYSAENDCMQLAVEVAREFGHEVIKPHYGADTFAQAKAVRLYKEDVCECTLEKKDGNPVLFLCRNRFYHIGVFVFTGGEEWVLHADQQSGFVILTRLRDMSKKGYELEGFYQWI